MTHLTTRPLGARIFQHECEKFLITLRCWTGIVSGLAPRHRSLHQEPLEASYLTRKASRCRRLATTGAIMNMAAGLILVLMGFIVGETTIAQTSGT